MFRWHEIIDDVMLLLCLIVLCLLSGCLTAAKIIKSTDLMICSLLPSAKRHNGIGHGLAIGPPQSLIGSTFKVEHDQTKGDDR